MPTSTATQLWIPGADGSRTRRNVSEARHFPRPGPPITVRTMYAAPHTVADALAEYTPGETPPVDWERTIAFRRHLWSYGIGVAEAMDTSERGMTGLRWPAARELIRRSLAAAAEVSGAIVCGAGTDQLTESRPSLDDIVRAYLEQATFIEDHGGSVILRVSHALHAVARSAADYRYVYDRVLAECARPAIVHWLGTVFDPTIPGYWGHSALEETAGALLQFAHDNSARLAGIKVSILDAERERAFRAQLPPGLHVYTGDDHDYPSLILGDDQGFSQGLLGVLDPIAPVASVAIQALERGDGPSFLEEMSSTLPLALRMFEPPADRYKVGTVFMAYLSGHQDHFRMITGREGMRSTRHLTDLFVLGDDLGLYPDPDLAAHRMAAVLACSGFEQ